MNQTVPCRRLGDRRLAPGLFANVDLQVRRVDNAMVVPESAIAPLMEEVNARYPGLKAFSLPSMGEGGVRRHIELGVRGAPGQIAPAMDDLRKGVAALGGALDVPKG